MTTNERIVEAAWRILQNPSFLYRNQPGMCLATVRIAIEQGMDWKSHALYDLYITDWVQPEGYDRGNGHWARDFERSAHRLNWQIPHQEIQPGDILCNWRSAWSDRWGEYIGHIGIVVERGVMENIDPRFRTRSLMSGALALTPLSDFEITSAFRLPG